MAGAVHSERAARKNVGSIPAGNGLCDFASFRLAGIGRTSALGLIRSVPLAHLWASSMSLDSRRLHSRWNVGMGDFSSGSCGEVTTSCE
jgi:hypothetical protein